MIFRWDWVWDKRCFRPGLRPDTMPDWALSWRYGEWGGNLVLAWFSNS